MVEESGVPVIAIVDDDESSHFVRKFAERQGKVVDCIPEEVMEALLSSILDVITSLLSG
jgi:hypothetical protein